MDRISKALEQAKQGVAKTRPHKARTEEIVSVEPINYTKTKKVALSSDLLRENRIFIGTENTQIVDTYGLLRTRVVKAMRKNNWKTIGVTSPDPSVGKTVTAINLAISIALDHNYSTLLVDTDLRRPGISKSLGLECKCGLSDYLTDDKSMEDLLLNPEIEHLVIAPTNRVESGSSELLSSPRMRRFVEEAKERYPERLVIFDLPPVLVGDDVVALSQHLDTLLIVVEDGKTQSKDLNRATELLKDVNILGVVLNKGTAVSDQYEYYK